MLYLSDAWINATWLGTQALKNPLDLWVYQEIVYETRPELIVETGTYRGGSALYLASLCDLVGHGEVVSIDIEPSARTIPPIRGSRTSPAARRRILPSSRRYARGLRGAPCSSSSTPTIRRSTSRPSLPTYASLVPVGCYLIVEDSNIGQIRKDLMPGPLEAIETFLATTDEFEIDREREKFLITFNPSGYLRRVREPSP